jgi:hypothetical protein
MSVIEIDNKILNDIVAEVKKLDAVEQSVLLTKLRVKRLASKKVPPVANYDMTKIKPPTMAQIDKWKHEARKAAKEKANAK